MRTLVLLLCAAMLGAPLFAADSKKSAGPKGQPDYQRAAENWLFGAWHYKHSRVIHGRLRRDNQEVVGKRVGETVDTPMGAFVWRGDFVFGGAPTKSTGWLLDDLIVIGPAFISDRYDPKTDSLR